VDGQSGKSSRIHYGWVIVLTGGLTVFSCLGLARFAYSMLLPSMGKALALGYDQMGFIGTGNFAGYLLAGIAPQVAQQPLGQVHRCRRAHHAEDVAAIGDLHAQAQFDHAQVTVERPVEIGQPFGFGRLQDELGGGL